MDLISTVQPVLPQCVTDASFWVPRHIVSSAWTGHAPFAFWLVQATRPRVIVELGTHNGFSHLAFCQAVQQGNLATRCYAVDTWKGDEHAGFYGEEVFAALNATHERSYSAFSRLIRARFDEALPHFRDGEVDLLHIDGRHRYEDVLEDFESWRPKLSDRAVVLFHDTNVRERDFGVWRLWDELGQARPSFTFVHGHGLGVLAVGRDTPPGLRPLLECDAGQAAAVRAAYARLGSAVTYQEHLDTVTAALHARAEQVRQAEQALALAQAELTARGGAARGLEEELARARTDLEARDQQAHRLEEELARARTELDARDRRAHRLEEELARARTEIDARNQQAHRLEECLARAEGEIAGSIELLDVARASALELGAEASGLREEASGLKEEVRTLADAAARNAAALADTTARLDTLKHGRATDATAAQAAVLGLQDQATALRGEAEQLAWALQRIETSTTWRVTWPVRSVLTRVPPGARQQLRRTARLAWWIVTPHRLPARLGAMRASRAASTGTPAVAAEPTPGGGALPPEIGSEADIAVVFDAAFYLSQLPANVVLGMSPLDHYRQVGWRNGHNPHPLFDVRWYLEHNPDVMASDREPFDHYLNYGWREGRDPHPLVDSEWTLATNSGWDASGLELMRRLSVVPHAAPTPQGRGRRWDRSDVQFGDEVPRVLPVLYTPPGRAEYAALDEAAVEAALAEVDILSLDIFDTALFRSVAHPSTAFEILEETLRPLLGAPASGFADARFSAERIARQEAVARGASPEIGIDDIYSALRRLLDLSEEQAAACRDREIEVERLLLCANPRVLRWASGAIARGKRVIFVSDMYLPARVTAEVLRAQGFPAADVYMSCDFSAGKWEGKLFAIAAEGTGVAGPRILHIGDNPGSDVRAARDAGWRALHYEDGAERQPYALQLADGIPAPIEKIAFSVTVGAARLHRVSLLERLETDAYERLARLIGYEILGPTVLGFAGWMAARARADRLDRVLFLSRDGWLPYQAFRRIRAAAGQECEARYLFASRRLMTCVALRSAADIAEQAPHFTRYTTLAEYGDILGLAEQDLTPVAERFGFRGLHEPVWPAGDVAEYDGVYQRLKELLLLLAPVILERAAARRAKLVRYCATASDAGGVGRAGIVDLGWSGRLMPPFEQVFREVDPALALSAYFFGTGSGAREIIPESISWLSYFFHATDGGSRATPLTLPDLRRPADIIGASISLVETLISANHTTVVDLDWDTAGQVRPVYASDGYNAEQRRFLAVAHEACLAFVEDVLPRLPADTDRWDFRDAIGKGWGRLLLSPSRWEAEFLGAFPHRADASGFAPTTRILAPPESTLSTEGLWREWQASLWPAGWFASLDSFLRAKMLRARPA